MKDEKIPSISSFIFTLIVFIRVKKAQKELGKILQSLPPIT